MLIDSVALVLSCAQCNAFCDGFCVMRQAAPDSLLVETPVRQKSPVYLKIGQYFLISKFFTMIVAVHACSSSRVVVSLKPQRLSSPV
ncbi:hypothetical protein L873DRAFT_1157713 [Choiromyces venosus 120613-1]|uniref:Uncharacterized protein n=1 Tax=Choiromyces venosus 120613-1 TaxID=1336337 RepID=A0A3N4JFP6_9PEZI|nr:hypothetical protein L873DRAFT_1157713 [Choiromyces venosus 120613-1]